METSPSAYLYELGSGELYIGEWSGDTPPVDWTHLGYVEEFSVEDTEETFPNYEDVGRQKILNQVVVVIVGYEVAFTLGEASVQNLQLFMRGSLENNHIIHAGQALGKEYALKFVPDYALGPSKTWEFWKVALRPGGPLNLISDDIISMPFLGIGLTDATNHPSSPLYDVTFDTTTTTTTTTTI